MSRIEHDTGVISRISAYSDAVEMRGNLRFLSTSGTPGFDDQGKLSPDFTTQAECAWRNVLKALAAADMGPRDIVRVTQYLVRREDGPLYQPLRTRFLDGAKPASMLMYVAGLPWPEMLIEIQLDAVKAV